MRARADLPLASECGPLLKVVVMMRRAALPFMTVRSTSTDVDQRFWATHVLGELLLPEASNAILPRLFDEDVAVRRVARRAGQALAAAGAPGEPLKHSLANTMRNPEEPMQRRLLAIEALAEIRVPSIVPILIPALVDDSDGIIEAVRTALVVLTRQDLGRNPEVWEAWWELHRSENRIEWLIQSLTHDIPSIRRAAGDELKLVTREYFGYYDDLPPKERERAQARYAQWWKDEGQYRFR
jgi:HEAT repeat protein